MLVKETARQKISQLSQPILRQIALANAFFFHKLLGCTSAKRHFKTGKAFLRLGDHKRAAAFFKSAHGLEPSSALYAHAYGTALFWIGNIEDARSPLLKANALFVEKEDRVALSERERKMMACNCLQIGAAYSGPNKCQSQDYFKAAMEFMEPGAASFHKWAEEMVESSHFLSPALMCFSNAIRLYSAEYEKSRHPDLRNSLTSAYSGAGKAAALLGDYPLSIRHYTDALSLILSEKYALMLNLDNLDNLDPACFNLPLLYLSRGHSHWKNYNNDVNAENNANNDYLTAFKFCEMLLPHADSTQKKQLNKTLHGAAAHIGFNLYSKGDVECIYYLEKAHKANPHNLGTKNNLAVSHCKYGDFRRGVALLESLPESHGNGQKYVNLAHAYLLSHEKSGLKKWESLDHQVYINYATRAFEMQGEKGELAEWLAMCRASGFALG
jgi:tetratricopeptide (TPR) repeat protein